MRWPLACIRNVQAKAKCPGRGGDFAAGGIFATCRVDREIVAGGTVGYPHVAINKALLVVV